MKVIKSILAGIGVLAALLCALIIWSAVNPNITNTLSSLVTGNGLPDKEKEAAQEDNPAADEYEWEEPTGEPFEAETESGENDAEDADGAFDAEDETSGDTDETADSAGDDYSYNTVPSGTGNDSGPVRGTNGYEAPSELAIKVPEAVNGKAGYQPITEKSEALPDAEGGEYTSTLGYGETGDGLFFDANLYPYYHMIDQKGQHIYRQIYANATVMNAAFVPIEAVPVSEIKNVVMAVYNDHPELFG